MPAEEGVVVVRRDGRIDAVGGVAPEAWVGLELAHAGVFDADECGRFTDWLGEPQGESYATAASFRTSSGPMMVVLLDALPVRRTFHSPSELVMRAMDLFMEQARDNRVTLRVSMADDAPSNVEIDPDKLAWVLATLIGNALRMLTRKARAGAECTIEVAASRDVETGDLVLRVRDDGPGMPPETARWLFEPDPSTGRPVGLALVMVREVMAAHGGSIEVESALGSGTTFSLRLPTSRAP